MDRREFLRRALSLAPALVVVPPVVSYFLPPRGGWPQHSLIKLMEEAWARLAYLEANPPLILWGEHTVEGLFDRQALTAEVARVWEVPQNLLKPSVTTRMGLPLKYMRRLPT